VEGHSDGKKRFNIVVGRDDGGVEFHPMKDEVVPENWTTD
jgi:hypothetical protein